jgi:uncharacterized protein
MIEETIIAHCAEFSFARMRDLKPSHGWDHVQRVIHLAERIARVENADLFIVHAASLLHDIARGEGGSSGGKIRPAKRGSDIAREFLVARGLDDGRARHIADCIHAHRFRNNEHPASIEAQCLYDADKLDSIGAIGVGRAFLFAGEVGAKLHNPGIDISTTSAYSEEDTAYREYMVKLRRIREHMLTGEGKRIATGRHEFMERFFERLNDEAAARA